MFVCCKSNNSLFLLKGDVSVSITNPKNVDLNYDIDQKGDEILEVKYEPKIPGPHLITVTFNNQEIPQSPIKVNIEPDIDVTRVKITGVDPSKFYLLIFFFEFLNDIRVSVNENTNKNYLSL